MRIAPLVTGEIYHICNRSTEGIPIFVRDRDARRFLKTLDEANNSDMGPREIRRSPLKVGVSVNKNRKRVVDIYAITLMPNHFHICVKQLVDGGITRLMQRTCNSFSHYFNIKYERKGTLFMGRFLAVPVIDNRQLFHLFVYIHANPLDMIMPKWRECKIIDWQKASSFLKNYKWSSWGIYTNSSTPIAEIQNLVTTTFSKSFLSDWGGLKRGLRGWSDRYYKHEKEVFLE